MDKRQMQALEGFAATPGVSVNPSARDSAGQPAVETRWTGSGKTVYTVYEDPATGADVRLAAVRVISQLQL